MTALEKVMKQLPPDLQTEALHYAQFLLINKAQPKSNGARQKPIFRWAGSLSDLGKQYSCVELQHTISRWRTGEL